MTNISIFSFPRLGFAMSATPTAYASVSLLSRRLLLSPEAWSLQASPEVPSYLPGYISHRTLDRHLLTRQCPLPTLSLFKGWDRDGRMGQESGPTEKPGQKAGHAEVLPSSGSQLLQLSPPMTSHLFSF